MNTVTIISNKIWCNELQDYYIESNFLKVIATPELWTYIEFDGNISTVLQKFFESGFPLGARIYHCSPSQGICDRCDVTPFDEESINKLHTLQGDFTVVCAPGTGIEAALIAAVIIAVVAIAAVFLFKPAVPSPAMRNTQSQSPNNELSSRTNEARPLKRIEDIYGTVRATPSLITVPMTTYIDHQEVEDVVLCLGRGSYYIHDGQVRDGETSGYDVDGFTCEIYRPNVNINTGAPYYRIGSELTENAMRVGRSNSVNGQELLPPNYRVYKGNNDTTFQYPNIINTGTSVDGIFRQGDTVEITNTTTYEEDDITDLIYPINATQIRIPYTSNNQVALYNNGTLLGMPQAFFQTTLTTDPGAEAGPPIDYTVTYNLSGTYEIASATKVTVTVGSISTDYCEITLVNPSSVNPIWSRISSVLDPSYISHTIYGDIIYTLDGAYDVLGASSTGLTLSNPEIVNPAWADLQDLPAETTPNMSPIISAIGERWIGWFTVENTRRTQLYCNFVALNGLYKDNGKNQYAANIEILVQVQQVDTLNNPIGGIEEFTTTLLGSVITKATRANTLKITTSFSGRCQVRCKRVTPEDTGFEGSVIDEVKWRDLYAISPLSSATFGNVTMIRLRTYGTAGALALKDRKLNMLVTRELPKRVNGLTFTTELFATNNAADIISAVSLDPFIGMRTKDEINFDNIYDIAGTGAEIETYFDTALSTEFSYTFDSDNLTYEETMNMIAGAVFCKAYRRGSLINLYFEKETDKSTLLFCHRNKIPGSESRTTTFGYNNDNDGIEYDYISPADDSVITMYIPEDRNYRNPQKHESVGVRSETQAYFHAWRLYNKLIYQHTITSFEATQEATLLVIGNRILVADNTRSNIQDGEVLGQNGLLISTSRSVSFDTGVKYYIFLQMYDNSVESMRVYAVPGNAKQVLLQRAPRMPLVYDMSMYARTTYILVREDKLTADAFLLTETSVQENFNVKIEAINYDSRYYANDKNYVAET